VPCTSNSLCKLDGVSSVAWLGESLIAGCADGSLQIFTIPHGHCVWARSLAHGNRIRGLDVMDKSRIVSGGDDGIVRVRSMLMMMYLVVVNADRYGIQKNKIV